jgi:response regulator RpfG family c-di-GMP phosphodiesterase
MSPKVLCIDDNPNVLAALKRNLRKRFDIDTAEGGELALEMLDRDGPYAVVVADMQMPGMNGIELLAKMRQMAPDTVRIMLTGNADQRTPVDAVNLGHVFRFLNKPCPIETMIDALEDGIKQYHLIIAERDLLENTLNGSVKVLMDVLSLVDPSSFGRSHRLRDYARRITAELDLQFTWELELATLLSQIGIVSLPPTLIKKVHSGLAVTGAEEDMLLRVSEVGSDLLANIPRLESVARIIRYQDKHLDGTGFPRCSIKGKEIPIESRIIKPLKDLLQLESASVPASKAVEQLRSRTGWYDLQVLDAAFRCFVAAPKAPAPGHQDAIAVTVAELRSDQVLLSDVRTKHNVLLVAAGTKVSSILLARLNNFATVGGINEPIYVEAERQCQSADAVAVCSAVTFPKSG